MNPPKSLNVLKSQNPHPFLTILTCTKNSRLSRLSWLHPYFSGLLGGGGSGASPKVAAPGGGVSSGIANLPNLSRAGQPRPCKKKSARPGHHRLGRQRGRGAGGAGGLQFHQGGPGLPGEPRGLLGPCRWPQGKVGWGGGLGRP